MNEQKMREEFATWCKENPALRSYMWAAWRAACANRQKEIDDLKANVGLRKALSIGEKGRNAEYHLNRVIGMEW